MTFAEAAPAPARLASWHFRCLGVSVAGDSVHAEFVPCGTDGTAYSDASSQFLFRVDAVLAIADTAAGAPATGFPASALAPSGSALRGRAL